MRRLLPVLVPVMVGCRAHCDLREVPVRGGTDVQEEEARAVLAQAEGALALPICVDHVGFSNIWEKWHAQGAYNAVSRGIRLAPETELQTIPSHLRHELCHAVDLQNELSQGREELFYYPDGYHVPELSRRGLVKEAFAWTCASGAEPLSVLWADGCPLDPDLEGTRLVQHEVYGLDDTPPAPAVRFERIVTLPVDPGVIGVGILETNSGYLSVLLQFEGGGGPYLLLDPWTGEAREVPPGGPADRPLPIPPASPPGWESRDGEGGLLADGSGVLMASFEAWTGRVYRTFSWRNGAFAPVDAPCPNATARFFYFGSELWSAQIDSDTLSWGRWIPLP